MVQSGDNCSITKVQNYKFKLFFLFWSEWIKAELCAYFFFLKFRKIRKTVVSTFDFHTVERKLFFWVIIFFRNLEKKKASPFLNKSLPGKLVLGLSRTKRRQLCCYCLRPIRTCWRKRSCATFRYVGTYLKKNYRKIVTSRLSFFLLMNDLINLKIAHKKVSNA